MKTYKAPWSTSLVAVSSLVTLLCLGIAADLAWRGAGVVALLPLAIVLGALVFTIRGYTVTDEAILVHRLLWSTRLPLGSIESAEIAPDIMRGGIRVFGNGGLFSFSGWFRNRALGSYRSFVTDSHRTVLLRYPARAVVVSPDAPEEFIRDVRQQRHAA